MEILKHLFLFLLLLAMPLTVFPDSKSETLTMKVGDSKALSHPGSPNSKYPELSPNGTTWSWSGPIVVTSDYRPASIAIKATGAGTAVVTCNARYWDASVFPSGNTGFAYRTMTWYITIVDAGSGGGGTGGGGSGGGGGSFNGDKDFVYNDYVTSATEEGVSITFWIHDSNYSEYGKWPCSVMSDDPWGGKAAIDKYTSGKVTIPEIVPGTKGCSVENSFRQRTLDLDGLIVKSINVGAFYECKNLTEVVIPSSVEAINTQAFDGCTSLEQVTLLSSTPPEVKNEEVFMQEAYSRVVIRVPKGAKSAYQKAAVWKKFQNIYEEGETISYKDGDTFMAKSNEGLWMKFQVISAKDKTCRTGVPEDIDRAVDYDTKGAVTIPSYANGLKVVEIGSYSFQNISGITSVSIPNSVQSIGDWAFYGCKGLASITVPSSVNSIGENAFYSESITELYISDLVAWINVSMSGSPFDWHNSIRLYLNNKEIKDLVIPNSVTAIKDYTFDYFGGLTSVTIPSTVKSIGSAFYNCTGLKEVHCEIKEPFNISTGVFNYMHWDDAHVSFYNDITSAALYVPAGTGLKYKKRSGWKEFKTIVDPQLPTKTTVTTLSSPIKQLAAGFYHSLALTEDGTLYGWGDNSYGQIGLSDDYLYEKPTRVMSNVASIATNNDHTLIVKTDGTLWACGSNSYGQLGDGSKEDKFVPVMITDKVASAVAGYYSTMVLKEDGTVWTCGLNQYGQLGTNDTESRNTLVKVADGVASIGAGAYSSYIVKKDGSLWGCGQNNHGQLADKTTEDRSVFVKITDKVLRISSKMGSQLLAIKTDGSLWSAGFNHKGQLGDGTTNDRNELKKMISNATSSQGTWNTSVVLKSDGTLWGCGSNVYGLLGDGTTNDALSLKKITNDVSDFALGVGHTLILKSDGSLWICGNNSYAQLGDGTLTDRFTPVKVIDAPVAGISDIRTCNKTSNTVYNISGQRLKAPRKGINIVGGRKVVVK